MRYLQPLHDRLLAKLNELGPRVVAGGGNDPLERRDPACEYGGTLVAGLRQHQPHGLRLAIVRELWRWRQAEAERMDKPARRILRDDLIIELAKRQTADLKQIQAVRGMEWGRLRSQVPEISECIRRGLETPEKDFVRPPVP